jgi:NADH-quinone oxidoreductase subunit B
MPDPASPAPGGPESAGGSALTTTADLVFEWARSSAIRPIRLGLACCAVEMTAALDPRYELSRRGSLPAIGGPRRTAPPPAVPVAASDLLIVAGTVSEKLAPWLLRLWDQMPQPKWALAVGACATCGGPFPTYAVTQGIDRLIPVDVYVPGCPPPPEALLLGLLHLERKIARLRGRR